MTREEELYWGNLEGSPSIAPLKEEVEESTSEDYWNVVNPWYIQVSNPSLRVYDTDVEGTLDTSNESFQEYYKQADIDTKRAMLGAMSTSHAIKIYEMREIQRESQKRVSNDNLMVQLGMGLVPAIADPINLIPIAGTMGKFYQIGKTANRIRAVARGATLGATEGAITNIASEQMYGLQGMEEAPIAAGILGAVLGGGLGGIGGLVGNLSGTKQLDTAEAILTDTYTFDFTTDPHMIWSEDGRASIVPEKVNNTPFMRAVDKTVYINDFLKSDRMILADSDSGVIRRFAQDLSPATVSLKDANGNPIPQPVSAWDLKIRNNGIHGVYELDMDNIYKDSINTRQFTGSRQDFDAAWGDGYSNAVAEQRAIIQEQLQAELDVEVERIAQETQEKINQAESEAARAKILKEAGEQVDEAKEVFLSAILDDFDIDAHLRKHSGGNEAVYKAMKRQHDFYTQYKKVGEDAGSPVLKRVHDNTLYKPRIWNFDKIDKMSRSELADRLFTGIKDEPEYKGLSLDQIKDIAYEMAETLKAQGWATNFKTSSFVAPKTLPLEARLKMRKLSVNDAKLGDILVQDQRILAGHYNFTLSGRHALMKKFGTDDISSIVKETLKDAEAKGEKVSDKDMKALEALIEDVAGVLRLNTLSNTPAWKLTRTVKGLNAMRFGGGFGLNQLVELASVTVMTAFKGLLGGSLGRSIKSVSKIMFSKSPISDDFNRFMVASGQMDTALVPHHANRLADTETGLAPGLVERGIQGANDIFMKYNGMRPIQAIIENYAGAAVMETIKDIAKLPPKGFSKSQQIQLSRWGLSITDARKLGKEIEKAYKDGQLDLTSMSEWGQSAMQMAVERGVSEVVVQGNSIHFPRWAKAPSAFVSLTTQFLRFPITAHETLLRRGYTEEQAKLVGGVAASVFAYMSILYLREQAAIATGAMNEWDKKYDYFSEIGSDDAIQRGLLKSFNYLGQLGVLTDMWNRLAVISGNPELGRGYASRDKLSAMLGPTFSGAEDAMDVSSKIFQGDFGYSYRDYMKLKQFLPFMNLPIISEGINEIVKEF